MEEELVVYSIDIRETTLWISASCYWLLLDISDADDVYEFTIEEARFSDEILHPEREFIISEYDIEKGRITLYDEQNGNEYIVNGTIRVCNRWYTKSEILTLLERTRTMYLKKIENNRKSSEKIIETVRFVIETYRRSEIKLSAGKPVHILNILEQIEKKLRA